MGRKFTRHPRSNGFVAGHTAMQPGVPMDGLAVRLVRTVLERLFLFVGLSDNILCHTVHWLVRSFACPPLHNRFGATRRNCLLLKWPLCFGDRHDTYPTHRQFRYIDLLRYNLSLQVPPGEVIKQVHLFLAGYEAVLLSVVYTGAVNSRYSSLNTFIVDFTMHEYRDYYPEEPQQLLLRNKRSEYIMQCPDDKVAAGKVHGNWYRELPHHAKCLAKDELFSGNWQKWAETITAIVNSCGNTLSHFVFSSDTSCVNVLCGEYRLRLPDELYRALNFDKMLSEMPNLLMLRLPIHDYEMAFVGGGDGKERACKLNQAALQKAWPLLRRMPPNKILPHLQRMVVRSLRVLLSTEMNEEDYVCGLPSLPRETDVMLETYADYPRIENGYGNHVVFPHATTSFAPYCKSKLFIYLPRLDDDLVMKKWFFVKNAVRVFDNTDHEKLTVAITAFVNGEASIRERQQRLSVLNDMRRIPTKEKAVIVVPITYLDDEGECDEYEQSVVETVAMLIGMLQTRRVCPSAVRIRFEEAGFNVEEQHANSNWNWGCMRPLLPFFASAVGNGNNSVANAILGAMRIDMRLHEFTSFGAKVSEWLAKAQQLGDGSENLFGQKYTIPSTNLAVYNSVPVSAGDVAMLELDANAGVDAIEQKILQQIRAFLRDAVDSRARRDLSFYLYQSLKRVDYNFAVLFVDLEDGGDDDNDANKQLKERIGLLLSGRAAKFEKLVMYEVFAGMLNLNKEFESSSSSSTVRAEGGCDRVTESVLKLSALRSISSNMHVRMHVREEEFFDDSSDEE